MIHSIASRKKSDRLRRWAKKTVAVSISIMLAVSVLGSTAFAEEGNSSARGDQNSPNAIVLPLPENVTAVALDYSSIKISWDAVEGAYGYLLYSSPTEDGYYSAITYTTSTSYIHSGLIENTNYYYKLSAFTASGVGHTTYPVHAVTQPMPPSKVHNVIATAINMSEIKVSWDATPLADKYYVYSGTDPYAINNLVAVTTDTGIVDSGLKGGTTYYYRIQAVNGSLAGEVLSDVASATTFSTVVTYITATALSPNSIELTWDAVEGAYGYMVYCAPTEDGVYMPVSFTYTKTFTHKGLSENTNYYYKIAIVDRNGLGVLSEPVHAVTLHETPEPPSNVHTKAISTSEIKVSWSAAPKALKYRVYVGSTPSDISILVGETSETSIISSGLSDYSIYYYRVESVNGELVSAPSDIVSARTLGVVPSIPQNVAAEFKGDSVHVTWDASSDANMYVVYRSTTKDGLYSFVGNSTSLSFEDKNVIKGGDYYYKVYSSNNYWSSWFSEPAHVKTVVVCGFSEITLNAEALGPDKIRLTWNASSDESGEAVGYLVYRSMAPNGVYTLVGSVATPGFEDRGLMDGTTYYYKVAPYNHSYLGDQSAYASATTVIICVFDRIFVTGTSLNSGTIEIAWNDVSDQTGKATYLIYRSTSPNGDYSYIGSTTKLIYEDKSVMFGGTYYYKVAAYKNGQVGERSDYVAVMTTISCYFGDFYTSASALSPTSVKVRWTPRDNASGYYVYRSTSASGVFQQIATTTDNSYIDTGLSADTKYYYRVSAFNDTGIFDSSPYTSLVTPAIGLVNTPNWSRAF